MEAFAAELRGCLGEPDGASVGPTDQTLVVPGAPRRGRPRRRTRAQRAPMERPSIWPLILLLAGLAILAGIFAAVFAFTGSPTKFTSAFHKATGGGSSSGGGQAVHLSGISGYDPMGDGGEHNDVAGQATDGNQSTYWYTEHYSSANFGNLKSGVGLVLDAGSAKKLKQLTVKSDTPGFTAKIEFGQSATGPFTAVSGSQTVGGSTTFSLHGSPARYYVIWITQLPSGDVAHVNEATAKN
jgi:hypothetical protein